MDCCQPGPPIRQLGAQTSFQFACHPGVPCFTDCCRQLDLVLTPYDVLRLRGNLGLSSEEFLQRYAIIEQEEGSTFPHVFLTMVDDGRASCPFVTTAGCTVYQDRPGACRFYPVGRGVTQVNGLAREQFVLLAEPHCHGFEATTSHTVASWTDNQELACYTRANDLLLPLLQHPELGKTKPAALDKKQLESYIEALYNTDQFSRRLGVGAARHHDLPDPIAAPEAYISHTVTWLVNHFFGR